jgi:hypothetical protein
MELLIGNTEKRGSKMTVRQIVEKYLRENGYDGLYNSNDCACDLNDLMPCGFWDGDCKAGYKHSCNCEVKHNFHICSEKSKGTK